MATVFMKWLESSPKDYDRGIQILTLGRLRRLKARIAQEYVQPGIRVLEIGCGTGTLAVAMAQRGAEVTAIDASPAMLAEARHKVAAAGLEGRVALQHMEAASIDEHFEPGSFDLIVSTLVFSELPPDDQRYVLEACTRLLAAGGRLLVVDEVVPEEFLASLLYYLVRLPLALLTWLLTRTTTTALRDFDNLISQAGFRPLATLSYLNGSLVLYEAAFTGEPPAALPGHIAGRLAHRVTLRSLLIDLWAAFFRIIPPYPKTRPGLYALGAPTPKSPVLVTGNFDLTVRRLARALDGRVDVWALVVDSAGINVWCAAGGGYLTAEKILAAVKSSRLEEVVSHHALILPQLCANGVDGWKIRRESGWGVHWGPVRAGDIPAYLSAGRKKDESMRQVRFPLKDRLEMVTVTLGFYGLLILLPVFLFWQPMFWPLTISLFALSYLYAIVLPWLPGRDGLHKSIPLAIISLAGLWLYATLWHPMGNQGLFNWAVGLTGLSVFVAAEMQGMSPRMRGEQANWGWGLLIAAILLAIYWLAPLVFGWR